MRLSTWGRERRRHHGWTMRASTSPSLATQQISETKHNGSRRELSFDYSSLPPSVARFLRGQADRIRQHCASSIIQIGKALLEAKHHLSHGAFLPWVECEVGIPARTAQVYMRSANWAAGKSAT